MNPIKDIQNRIHKAVDLVQRYDGQVIDLKKEVIFTKEPFLHQSTETQTEEESANFERENPELFSFLRKIKEELKQIF